MRTMLALMCLASLACGRSAGPHEDEWGEVTYWLIVSEDFEYVGCGDAPELAFIEPESLSLGGRIAWYFLYEVLDGGDRAVRYTCPRMSAFDTARCSRLGGPEAIGTVADHRIEWSASDVGRFQLSPGCEARVHWKHTITDEGSEGLAVDAATYELTGSCEDTEGQLRAASANGLGLDGCVVRGKYGVVFSHVASPG